jgi:hypothetical protein
LVLVTPCPLKGEIIFEKFSTRGRKFLKRNKILLLWSKKLGVKRTIFKLAPKGAIGEGFNA